LGVDRGGVGGEFAGFLDDGVAREQGREDLAVGEVGGEVEGSEDGGGAEGFVACGGGLVARHADGRGVAFFPGAEREIDFSNDSIYFGLRFPEGLAGFEGDGLLEFGGVGLEAFGDFFELGGALIDGEARPGGGGFGGGFDSLVDLLDGSGGGLPDDLVERGVVAREDATRAGEPVIIEEEVGGHEGLSLMKYCRGVLVLRRWAIFLSNCATILAGAIFVGNRAIGSGRASAPFVRTRGLRELVSGCGN
jgi:hypothetical protein